MSLPTTIELMIDAVEKQRNELYKQVKQYDKIIKALKSGDVSAISEIHNNPLKNFDNNPSATEHVKDNYNFHVQKEFKGDTKIIILKAMDMIGKACKLSNIQDEYDRITGSSGNIRESIRTLNKAKKIWLMKEKGKSRGIYWVKKEWVEDGVLLDEFKPDGFDLLYSEDSLEYK